MPAAMSRQSCPTLCDPIDSSPAGLSVPGILQARILEWNHQYFDHLQKTGKAFYVEVQYYLLSLFHQLLMK